MKSTISKYDFREAFRTMGRQDQFSYEGLGLLFDWFEEYDECSGAETELDVIAICCEFSESDVDTIRQDYCLTLDDANTPHGRYVPREDIEEYLSENTLLVGQTSAGDYIYAAF